MWRRVASQSPSKSEDRSTEGSSKYLAAWRALGKLLASGRSLSGRERNCCFLNTQTNGFANISTVAGFDFPDDARAMATVDWDADGDLDVWVTNRTAPRVRFLKNNYGDQGNYVAVKLKGVQANHDAIGARIEIVSGDGGVRLVRSIRAGEGYLGQSSKWQHFGLAQHASAVQAKVRWPDGTAEVFRDLTANGRYVLSQGSGKVDAQLPRREVQLAASLPKTLAAPSQKRIVLPARIPLPRLGYSDFEGNETFVELGGKPLLLNLWATWCTPCLAEIDEWSKRADDLKQLGVDVLLLSVDAQTDKGQDVSPSQVGTMLTKLGSRFPAGMATEVTLDDLDVAQQVLTKRIRALPIPSTFLLDADGRLAVLYKGRVETATLLSDIGQLSISKDKHRDFAVPFAGRWYTNPFPPDLHAIPSTYRERNEPHKALDYLTRNVAHLATSNHADNPMLSPRSIAETLVELGIELEKQGDRERVVDALRTASKVDPTYVKARMALAMILQQSGDHSQAIDEYREMLMSNPSDSMAANNLSWLLATVPDGSLRAPDEAIALASMICKRSKRQFAPALDTLAVAQAAAGDFESAVATAEEAIRLLENQGELQAIAPIQKRLELFKRRTAYTER